MPYIVTSIINNYNHWDSIKTACLELYVLPTGCACLTYPGLGTRYSSRSTSFRRFGSNDRVRANAQYLRCIPIDRSLYTRVYIIVIYYSIRCDCYCWVHNSGYWPWRTILPHNNIYPFPIISQSHLYNILCVCKIIYTCTLYFYSTHIGFVVLNMFIQWTLNEHNNYSSINIAWKEKHERYR